MMRELRSIHKNFFTIFLIFQSLLFLTSCKVDQAALEKAAGEAGFTITNNTLSIIGGNNQSVVQNAAASTALTVMVRDQDGQEKAGVDVEFEIMTSNGGLLDSSVTEKTVTSGSNGRASVTYTAGTSLGEVVISATIAGSSVTFTQTVTDASSISSSSSGSTLLMLRGNNAVIEQNSTVQLEVLALNSAGVAMVNTDVTFEVLTAGSISNPLPAAGTPTGSGLAAKTGSNGRASVNFTAPSTLGTATIVARSTAGSVAFNLSVGVAGVGSTLSISNGNGQVIVPNSIASEDLEVIATSASGSPLSGITVTFTVTTTNGGVLSNSQGILVTTTDANGKASTSFTSSNTSGPISVLASSSVGSVTFALNTSTNGSGGSGGNISFNPTTFSPASGSWLNTNVGAAPSKSVTVTNTASYDLYINSIFTTTSTPFNILSDNCPRSPAPLASTDSCTVVISFSPTGSETFSKFLFLNWSGLNDGSNGQNAVLPLEGSGPPALTFAGITSVDNITTTGMRLNWLAATGGTVSQYRVYQISSGVPTLLATLPHTTLSYTLSGLVQNTTYTYRVRAVNTANEEDGNNNDVSTVTDLSPVPVLTAVSNRVFPASPLYAAGSALAIDFNKTNATPETDVGMTYSCKFSREITGTLTGKSNCTQGALGGTFSFSSSTGEYSWIPRLGTQGVFEFAITGTDTNGAGYRYFIVDVAHPYASPNLSTLLADFRASFGNMTGPNTTSASSWSDLSGLNNTGTLTNGSALWTGSLNNTNTDPQRVTFNGTTMMDLNSTLSGYTKFFMDFWISNPESTFQNLSTVLKMDDDSTDNGFEITQNTLNNGKRTLRLDFERSYGRAILLDTPASFWRMDNGSGSTFTDIVGGNDLVYGDGAYGSTTSSGISNSQPGATLGELSSKSAQFHTNNLNLPNASTFKPVSDFSVEFWIKYPSKTIPADHTLYTFNSGNTDQGLSISLVSGVINVRYKPATASTVTLTPNFAAHGHLFDGNWHHLVFTSSNNYKALYVDGNVISSSNTNNGAITWPSTPDKAHVLSGADSANAPFLDEVAFYNFALSSNQVKNHLAAGDHFVRYQALYPANAIQQTKPLAYWRFGDNNDYMTQDFSGNQNDLIGDNTNYKTSQGVYMRAGGSSLDNNGAGYPYWGGDRQLWAASDRLMAFDNKLTYATWVNITSHSTNLTPIFTTYQWGDVYGVNFWITSSGFLQTDFNRTRLSTSNYVQSAAAVVPGSSNTTIAKGWYHLAMTYDGAASLPSERVQFYVNGYPVKMAAPVGTIPTTLSSLSGPGWGLQVAAARVAGNQMNGSYISGYVHDEDAIWDRVLPINEIRAQANEGSLRYCDIPVTTQTLDPVNSKPFDFISMLFDGVTLNIRRNSSLECSMRIGDTSGTIPAMIKITNESLPIVLGSSVNGFKGHLTDLRIHGADSSTVATNADAHTAFVKSADQHRVYPFGNIVTTNLVRSYEAASAFDGMRPHSQGCSDQKFTWKDIGYAPSGARQEPGYLKNFQDCTTNGWNGDGSPTNPYRLTFDGTNDWVDFGTTPVATNPTDKMTVCFWARTTQYGDVNMFNRGSTNNWGDFNVGSYQGQLWMYMSGPWTGSGGANYNTFRNGYWHYLCGRYNGSTYAVYLDGNSVLSAGRSGAVGNATDYFSRMTFGRIISWNFGSGNGSFYSGDLGAIHIYNDGLTDAQIKQNCNAQAANYNMTTCAP